MPKKFCSRCGKVLSSGTVYRVKISVFTDFNGEISIDEYSDYEEEVKNAREKFSAFPEDLIEEEIHQEFEFLICPECKEKFCANPLNTPLRDIKIPKKIPKVE
ncbi:MAG: hypothetical protein AB1393_06490 [Candidatus Edwardsbacteria bacterium]